MPRALAAAAAPECSGSHNAVPHARGMTAIATGPRLQAESAIKTVAAKIIPTLLVNLFLAVSIMCNCSCRAGWAPVSALLPDESSYTAEHQYAMLQANDRRCPPRPLKLVPMTHCAPS